MCYIEVCMVKIVYDLLVDLEKEMVNFVFNYDGSEYMFLVLLIWIFNFLINGLFGIVVGMVMNILFYNLGEVVDGCLVCIDNFDIDIDGLMEYI